MLKVKLKGNSLFVNFYGCDKIRVNTNKEDFSKRHEAMHAEKFLESLQKESKSVANCTAQHFCCLLAVCNWSYFLYFPPLEVYTLMNTLDKVK